MNPPQGTHRIFTIAPPIHCLSTVTITRPAKRGIKAECPQCHIVFRNASARNDACPRCDIPLRRV